MIRRASFRRRLARFPGLWMQHFRLMHKYNAWPVSAWSAWRLALKLLESMWE